MSGQPGADTLPAEMQSVPISNPEVLGRRAVWHGVLLGVAALLGVELAASSSWASTRATKPAVARVAAFVGPMLQPGSLVPVGAMALLLLMLARATRNSAFDSKVEPAVCRSGRTPSKQLRSTRKVSISHHTGGLYGP